MCSERQCIHHRGRELWALTPRQHANAWVIDEPGQIVTDTPISGAFLATEQTEDVRHACLQFEIKDGRLLRHRTLEPSKRYPFWEKLAPRLFSEPRRRVSPVSTAPNWLQYDQNHFRHEVHKRLVQNQIDAHAVIDALEVPTRARLQAWQRGACHLSAAERERLRVICGLDTRRLETCARLDRQVYAEDYRSWADEPHRPSCGSWDGGICRRSCPSARWRGRSILRRPPGCPVEFYPHRGQCTLLDHDGAIVETKSIFPEE
ncbi:MAG: hypothetical protein R3E66_01165 [bacterium]